SSGGSPGMGDTMGFGGGSESGESAESGGSSEPPQRRSWLDEKSTPMMDQYARQLGTFIEAMAGGVGDDSEIEAQEKRLVKLMRDVEPRLGNMLHEKVTRLLCELTAFNMMQMLHTMHQQRPQTRFRG